VTCAAVLAVVVLLGQGIAKAQAPCPALPPPTGPTIEKTPADADDLRAIIAGAAAGTTILLHDGVYDMSGGDWSHRLQFDTPNVTLRSLSGDREAVVLDGGYGTNELISIQASGIVIADLTLGHCRFHGIQVQGESPHDASGLHVHNCRLVNCNEQFIKGSSKPDDPVGATDGIIENCLFKFNSGWAYQYYTGGIDIHKGVNWIVRDNLFRNIRVPAGKKGMSEHAIHFWNRSSKPQNVVVERNQIINCDRGIGFGLGSQAGGHNGGSSAIRNNFVYNDGTGPATDVGIGLEHADHVAVENNTVFIANYRGPIEYRFASSSHLVFRNNLSNRPILARNDAPAPTLSRNLGSARPEWFADLANGDLHLTRRAGPALDAGVPLGTFKDDIDAERRPAGDSWDIGADEFHRAIE